MPSFKIFCSQVIYSFILVFIPIQTTQLLESGDDINITNEMVIIFQEGSRALSK